MRLVLIQRLIQRIPRPGMGTPVYDDATLFEFLILETFQAGLSWITILNKRENFRKAFDNFDYKKNSPYSEDKIKPFIGRRNHSQQIESPFCSYKCNSFMKSRRIWQFFQITLGIYKWKPIINTQNPKEVPATTHFLTPLAQI
jgi:DNA-3-methyladenine glycosylase I